MRHIVRLHMKKKLEAIRLKVYAEKNPDRYKKDLKATMASDTMLSWK